MGFRALRAGRIARDNLLFQGQPLDADAADHRNLLASAINDGEFDAQRLGQHERVTVNPGDFEDPDWIGPPRTMIADQVIPTRRRRGLDANSIPHMKARGTLQTQSPRTPFGICNERNFLPKRPAPRPQSPLATWRQARRLQQR